MDYSTLTTHIEGTCEETFTAAQLAMFTQQAEQKIYETLSHTPMLRKSAETTLTLNNEYLTLPTDYLYMHSLMVRDADNAYHHLVQVDENFIREAYPDRSTTGFPKYYGQFDVDSLIMGPTPDSGYSVRATYGYHPESIVTASTTWLGDNFDTALLNGALIEAARFMKEEEDIIAEYNKRYLEAMALLKMLGDGKLQQDSYRSGRAKTPVT